MMYFSKTGGYGNREDMTDDTEWSMILPVHHWTPAMFQRIADVDDEVRYEVAQDFSMGIHKINAVKMTCYTCGLMMEELNESALMEGWNKEFELSLSIDE